MFLNVDFDRRPKKPSMFWAKPDRHRKVKGKLNEAYGVKLNLKLGQLNELSFSIPYEIDVRNELKRNRNADEIKENYLIKFVYDTYVEWFIVTSISDSMSDSGDVMNVSCFSLGHQLNYKLIRNFKQSGLNAQQVLMGGVPLVDDETGDTIKDENGNPVMFNGVLENTNWTIDYIDPDFLTSTRSWDFNSTNVHNCLINVAETYNAVVIFNTLERKISLWNPDKIGKYRGLRVSYGKYMKSMTQDRTTDEWTTKLLVSGQDGLTIASLNPTGSDSLVDYSALLYPFEQDSSGKVIAHSNYFADDTCIAYIAYQKKMSNKQGQFNSLLESLKPVDADLDVYTKELFDLNIEMKQLEDSLDVAKGTGNKADETKANTDIANKQLQINSKKAQYNSRLSDRNVIITVIKQLQNDLSLEANFTADQIKELNDHTYTKEYNDDKCINAEDLLKESQKYFKDLIKPQLLIKTDIVNFKEIIEAQYDWDKLNLGDTMSIKYEKTNTDASAKIIELEFDFDESNVGLTIANIKDLDDKETKWVKMLYQNSSAATTFSNNKFTYDDIRNTRSKVNQLIEDDIDLASKRILAGVNESVEIGRRGIVIKNPDFPDQMLIAQAGVIAMSQNGGGRWTTAITPTHIVGEVIAGKLLAGVNLMIDASDVNGKKTFTVDSNGVTIDSASLNIKGGINSGQLDPALKDTILFMDNNYSNGIRIDSTNGIVVTRSDNKVKTIMNATNGIAIKSYELGTWKDKFYVDLNGKVVAEDLVANKLILKSDNTELINGSTRTINFTGFNVIDGKLDPKNLELRGLTIKNASNVETFKIDANGSITLSGNINWNSTNAPSPSQVGAVAKTQTDVFNTLTNNGATQGLFMSGGQLYINASYINGGEIVGVKFKTSGGTGRVELSNDQVVSYGSTYGQYSRLSAGNYHCTDGTKTITISPWSIDFARGSGTGYAFVRAIDGSSSNQTNLTLYATGNINLSASYTSFFGTVDLSSANVIGLPTAKFA